MKRSRKRLLLLFLCLPALVVCFALLYGVGMAYLEGSPRGFWDSLEWSAETLTTTGYGADSHWRHPIMVLYVVGVQFVGVFLVFLIVPIFLLPFLEEHFEARLPQAVEGKLSRHVLVFRYGAAVETLLAELAAAGVPTVFLERDEATARQLFESGVRVVHRGLDDASLKAARLTTARALIANGTDDENAALILAARHLGFTGPVLALVEEPFYRKPMMLAGATAVFTPRHILGAALAARVSARINPRLNGVQPLGHSLEIAEVRIEPDSRLAGKTLGGAGIGAETGATVIGEWVGGELRTRLDPTFSLESEGVLVVLGSHESIERVTELARGPRPVAPVGPFVVGGYGEVGRHVVELLRAVGEEVRVIDRRASPGVDLVGDVLDRRLLESAGSATARAVILALDTDSATLFATVILKELAPHVPVIARVNQAENVERIHRAGASFSLSLSQVSGQMLAQKLLGEEAVSIDPQLRVQKVHAKALEGRGPAALAVRECTGCSVVAVERGDEVLVDFGPDFRFAPDDAVYVCGSAEAVRRFGEVFG
ncbi:MAG TPA: NAD-binding protein [Thermoanaerobaculia bacterium]|nr:NAD-binding protein [Thermoanaerobaculia bacterium]